MKKYWKWTLKEDKVFDLNVKFGGKYHYVNSNSEWYDIVDNVLTIYAEYSWDGCSPKGIMFNKIVIGTWDGRVDKDSGLQKCYIPSLIHDVLCQFHLGTRKQADKLFYSALKDIKFKLARMYYHGLRIAARVAGGKDGWLS